MKTNLSDRRVFLGMPGYGEVTAGAGRAFWRASRLPDEQIEFLIKEGSLLTANFNDLWARALNLAHKGRSPDYFAMQHADVWAPDGWLDDLIAELEARDLDILGVVVPLKDTQGLTSLALAPPNGDVWTILCRLSMAEIYRLPETFTSEDVGHPLLLNTGLWVCKFDESWARKVHFTIADRIIFDVKQDRYVAQCMSEDWYVSRLWHNLGLKIGATRKIPVDHRGSMGFTNTRPWGKEPFDSAWIDKSVIPEAAPGMFTLPWDIDGWLREDEGKVLAELATGKRVLEIGSFCGLSTVCMARTAERIVTVDPHDGRGTPYPGNNTLPALHANLERYGVLDKVCVVVGVLASPEIAEIVDREAPFDLVFIDGAHDAESVEDDIAEACSRLASGGVLAFHDYRSSIDPDVTAAVDRLLASGGELLALHGSLAVVRPPAAVLSPLEV